MSPKIGYDPDRIIKYTTQEILVYPQNAAAVAVQGAGSSWGWGTWTEIVPASTITDDFLLIGVDVSYASIVSEFWVIQLGTGLAAAEVAKVDIPFREYDPSDVGHIIWLPVYWPVPHRVPANTRVAARLTQAGVVARTVAVKIIYLKLPL